MIAGAICFADSCSPADILLNLSVKGVLIRRSVSIAGFTGAFWLHPGLPADAGDHFYADEERDIVVLMSGSVYNRTEIEGETGLSGSLKDPQLVAELFLKKEEGFVSTLNGDFSGCILNPRKKQAFLFRDHLGICPMAWATSGKTLYFSSDITALCHVAESSGRLNSEYLLGYFKYIDYSYTPNDSVRKLLPGHILVFSESGVRFKKYWEPERIHTDRRMSYESMIKELGELVADAVRIRCDDRYTAGAHLSSGLDSGVVAALARREYAHQEDFCGLSWSPAGDFDFRIKYDERDLISKTGEMAGIRPVYSEMGLSRFVGYVSGFSRNKGYFSEDDTSDRASLSGINLIFSGFGGDEFISIGHSGIDIDLLRRFRFGTFFRRNSLKNPRRFARYFLFYVLNPVLCILDRRTRKAFREDARYIRKPFRRSNRAALRSFYCHRSRRQMHLNVFRFYNIPDRCKSWYLMGYGKGIEYRYPLLDRRIIEYMLKVPSELLCRTPYFRPLLREIGKEILPGEILVNESKNDPLYWAWMDSLMKDAAVSLMDEAGSWKSNRDLHFVDFELLDRDIRAFRQQSDFAHGEALFRALVYLKAIHEFTVDYRRQE